jgi:hypothetical protein
MELKIVTVGLVLVTLFGKQDMNCLYSMITLFFAVLCSLLYFCKTSQIS